MVNYACNRSWKLCKLSHLKISQCQCWIYYACELNWHVLKCKMIFSNSWWFLHKKKDYLCIVGILFCCFLNHHVLCVKPLNSMFRPVLKFFIAACRYYLREYSTITEGGISYIKKQPLSIHYCNLWVTYLNIHNKDNILSLNPPIVNVWNYWRVSSILKHLPTLAVREAGCSLNSLHSTYDLGAITHTL